MEARIVEIEAERVLSIRIVAIEAERVLSIRHRTGPGRPCSQPNTKIPDRVKAGARRCHVVVVPLGAGTGRVTGLRGLRTHKRRPLGSGPWRRPRWAAAGRWCPGRGSG